MGGGAVVSEQAMRVAIDAYHALFHFGGVARYARELIGAFARAGGEERFVLFYNRFRERGAAWKPDDARFTLRQFHCPRTLVDALWGRLNWPPVEALCGPVDIFHGLHFVLPPARRARLVLTVHDLAYLKHPEYYSDRALNDKGYKGELPRSLARAAGVIASSARTREDVIELLGFPAEGIKVVHLGVEPFFFEAPSEADAEAVLARYGIVRPYLIFLVVSPEPRQHIVRTSRAARRSARGRDLVILGERGRIARFLEGGSEGAKLLGNVPKEHLPALLSRAAISLYPSLYEGFGLPALESMASSVPVIASDRGALPEVTGGAALQVNPESEDAIAEAIDAILADEALARDLRERGRARARAFTWEKTAAETLSFYKDLL